MRVAEILGRVVVGEIVYRALGIQGYRPTCSVMYPCIQIQGIQGYRWIQVDWDTGKDTRGYRRIQARMQDILMQMQYTMQFKYLLAQCGP